MITTNCDNPPIVTGAANIVKGHYVAYKCDDPYTYNGGDHLWSCGSRQWRNTGVPLTCSVDGGWSPWGEWDACTATCGYSSHTRTQTCENPAPLNDGATCPGSQTDTDDCTVPPCPVDGGWSPWGEWDGCTATCGYSSHTRTRTCENPAPLNDGATCPGSQTDTDGCPVPCCPGPLVAVNAYLPGMNERIIYDDVTMNHGNAYSSVQGTFTAPLAGTYSFSISVCSFPPHFIVLDLMHNDNAVKALLAGDTKYRECTSTTTLLDLQTGDTVWVKHQGSLGDLIETFVSRAVSFTGFLLHAS